MALNFTEWSREAKDEFAQKRMEEMKLKNEALKQRYAEVEQDRIKAEAKDSAVTSVKISKKENIAIEKEDILKVEREWDKGKVDQDAEDWNPPKFFGYRSRTQRRNFQERNSPKKENWRVRSANVGKDRQSYSKFRSSGPNHKYQDSNNYGTSGFRNENPNLSRQKDKAHRSNSGTYRSFQNSRFDSYPLKKMGVAGSCSSSSGDLESSMPHSKVDMNQVWRCVEGLSVNQQKQSRVAKWVKEINTASSWNEDSNNVKGDDFYEKRNEGRPQDIAKTYGYTNEEGYCRKNQPSRDQTHLKNRERYDGSKYGPSSRGNSRARGSKTPTGERTTGGFEDKNQRDFRKRNYNDKNKFRRESDYHSCIKDKFNKTASDYSGRRDVECETKYDSVKRPFNSKSSDYSDIKEDEERDNKYDSVKRPFNKKSTDYSDIKEDEERDNKYDSLKRPFNKKSTDYSDIKEDEERDNKYDSEKTPFDKQSSARNYGEDKFRKSKNVQSPTISSSQDARKKGDFDDEYSKTIRQKFPNSYAKDKSKIKNFRNADSSGFDDQHVDNRVSARKKLNKYNTESKFMGQPGKFENESTGDYQGRTRLKYKISKSVMKGKPETIVDEYYYKHLDFNDPNIIYVFIPVDSDGSSSASEIMEDNPEAVRDDNEQKCVKSVDASRTVEDNPKTIKGDYEEKCKSVDTYLRPSTYVDEPGCTWADYEQTCFESVDNCSSTSETMNDNPKAIGANYDSDETAMENKAEAIMDDHEQETVLSIERNDNQKERKTNLMKEEIDMNKASLPLDWSTPVMTDCDTSCEKLFHENSELKNYEICGDAVSEFHDSNVEADNIESTCSNEIEKHGSVEDCNVKIDDTFDYSNDSVEYSGDQYEEDITEVQQLMSDVVNITVDSCESNDLITEGSKSLPEISINEVQNSGEKTVQSTETELTSCKLLNPESSDLEIMQEKNSLSEVSSTNTDCETSTKQEVENDYAEITHSEVSALSSQSMTASCKKFESESELKSSDLVIAEPQFPKRQGNGIENSSGALNMSDDGGWSTVSEDENNDVAGDDKNDKDISSVKMSDADLIM